MTFKAAESLRQLCSDYYRGLISRAEYRARRAVLVNAATSGDIDPSVATDASVTRPQWTRLPMVASPPPSVWPNRITLLILGCAALSLAAIVVFLLLRPAPPPESAAVVTKRPETLATGERLLSTDFFDELLDKNEWSASDISDFLFAWYDLTFDEQERVMTSDKYRSLTVALQDRIEQNRASGDEAQVFRLSEFRSELGLETGTAIPAAAP